MALSGKDDLSKKKMLELMQWSVFGICLNFKVLNFMLSLASWFEAVGCLVSERGRGRAAYR